MWLAAAFVYMAERNINVKFSILGADNSRQDIDKIRAAAEKFGDSGVQEANKLSAAFGNIQNAADKLEKKIQSGRQVTAADVGAMTQQFGFLRESINAAFGSLEQAPQEIQDAFALAEKQTEEADQAVRKFTASVEDHRSELDQAGERWTGFGDAIQKALGPSGAAFAKLTLAVGVATQAFQQYRQFAEPLGADFSEWDRLVDSLGTKFVRMNSELGNAAIALFSGRLTDAKNALSAADAALILSTDAHKGYKLALDAGLEGLEAMIGRQDELVKIQNFHTDAMAAGKAGQDLLRQALEQADGSAEKYVDAINKMLPALDALKKVTNETKDAEKKRQEVVNDAIKQIESVIEALKKEQLARKAGTDTLPAEMAALQNQIDTLKAARDAIVAQEDAYHGLTQSIVGMLEPLQETIETNTLNAAAADQWAAGLKKAAEDQDAVISPANKRYMGELTGLLESYEKLDGGQKVRIETLVRELLSMKEAAEGHAGAKVRIDETTGAITNVDAAADKSASTFEKVGDTWINAAAKIKQSGDILDQTKQKLDQLFEKDFAAESGIAALNTAIDEASGKLVEMATGALVQLKDALAQAKTEALALGSALNSAASAGMPGGLTPIPPGGPGIPLQ